MRVAFQVNTEDSAVHCDVGECVALTTLKCGAEIKARRTEFAGKGTGELRRQTYFRADRANRSRVANGPERRNADPISMAKGFRGVS